MSNKDSNDKKTLGVKLTLGLNKPTSGKLGLSSSLPVKKASTGSGKATVVVVTKSKTINKSAESQAASSSIPAGSSESDILTPQEKERRLQVLKDAEQVQKAREEEKLKQEELKRAAKAQEEKALEKLKSEAAKSELENNESKVKIKRPSIEKLEEADISRNVFENKKRNDELKSIIAGKGKVRNLDSIRTLIPKKGETQIQEKDIVSSLASKESEENLKKQKTDLIKKKPKDQEEDSFEKPSHTPKRPNEEKRANNKLSLAQVMMIDQEEGVLKRNKSFAAIQRAREKREKAKRQYQEHTEKEKIVREVLLPEFISVQELANRMSEKAADVIKSLMKLGMMVTLNQSIDADTAELIISEYGHKVKRVTAEEIEKGLLAESEDLASSLETRPPVVTVMGHVDHGKTSLLDALRQTDVAAGEAGGITQHIGAYKVTLNNGKQITFLDTPGHEAFTAMRARGAKVTDIVVLVVAADDGIMQQTIEAINHAKAANVPIIVAINKIDKPDADVDRVRNELLSHNLIPEEMGGDIIVVPVSARQKTNLEKLEESILLQAEVLDLKANPNRLAKGFIIEAQIDKGRGPVATLLVQKGNLKTGDFVVAGASFGKVRALINDKGQKVDSAGPSVPVEILGLNHAPTAGDEFIVTASEKLARDIAEFRINQEKEKALVSSRKASMDQLFKRAQDTKFKEFNLIIKGDVQGSIEAINNSLMKLPNEEIQVRILHSGVGGITESDIILANASNAFVIGFNVRANNLARELAKKYGVEIRYYSIIYNLVDEVKAAMSGMLSPVFKEIFLGYVDVKQVFDLSKFGKVAGCYVTEGMIKRKGNARLIRDNIVIYDGKLKALKRFKDDVAEVKTGFECGISFENYEDIRPGDKIEAYELIQEQRTL